MQPLTTLHHLYELPSWAMECISYPVSHNQAIWPVVPLVIIYRAPQIDLYFSCVQMYLTIFWSLYHKIHSPCHLSLLVWNHMLQLRRDDKIKDKALSLLIFSLVTSVSSHPILLCKYVCGNLLAIFRVKRKKNLRKRNVYIEYNSRKNVILAIILLVKTNHVKICAVSHYTNMV